MEGRSGDQLVIYEPQEVKEREQPPLKTQVWETAPVGDPEVATIKRLAEFFNDSTIPLETQALGLLSTDMVVATARQLQEAATFYSLNNNSPFAGRETLYGLALFPDRVQLAMTQVKEYGKFSIDALEFSMDHLDRITGGVAKDLAAARPELIKTLLSPDSLEEERNQAKVDLMRFLIETRPGQVGSRKESGFVSLTGLVFSTDWQNQIFKLEFKEIPETDPELGENVKFYKKAREYHHAISRIGVEDPGKMTVEIIAEKLKNLPEKARRLIVGKEGLEYSTAQRLVDLARILGIKPNQAQLTWEKSSRFTSPFTLFENKYREEILKKLLRGNDSADDSLSESAVDQMFRDSFNEVHQMDKLKILPDFSITKTIEDETSFEDLKYS